MPAVTHTIAEPWRSYLRTAIQEIESSRDEELCLLGMVHEARERAIRRRASLEEIIRLIAREAELPDISYDVAKDGSSIMGNVPDPSTPPAEPTPTIERTPSPSRPRPSARASLSINAPPAE